MKGLTRAQLFVNLLIVGLVVSIPAAWIVGGYLDIPVTALMGYRVQDGICVSGEELIGLHCFSDFTVVKDVLSASSPWDPEVGTAYPATGWMPAAVVWGAGQVLGGSKVATAIFLVILAVVALIPAIWAGLPHWRTRLPVTLLVLGVGASPILVVLDRANSTALIVLPVMAVALGLVRHRYGWVVTGIIIATLLKPQMIILILVLVPYRRVRAIALTLALSVGGLLLGFLVWPGDRMANISMWFRNLVGYSDYGTVDVLYPYNLSITRSLLTLSDGLGISALIGEMNRGHVVSLLTQYAAAPGVLLTLAVVVILWFRQRSIDPLTVLFLATTLVIIVPGTSFSYYLVLLLPVAALLLRDPLTKPADVLSGEWRGCADSSELRASRAVRARTLVIAITLVLVIVPLAIPFGRQSLESGASPDWVGLMQVLWGPVLLVASVLILIMVIVQRPLTISSSVSPAP